MNKPNSIFYWKHDLMWVAPFLLVFIAGVLSFASMHFLLVSLSFGPAFVVGVWRGGFLIGGTFTEGADTKVSYENDLDTLGDEPAFYLWPAQFDLEPILVIPLWMILVGLLFAWIFSLYRLKRFHKLVGRDSEG